MDKKDLFEKVYNDIVEINKSETKSIPDKIMKFNEEFGEFNAELIKMRGESYKEYSEDALKSEMADPFQVLLSIYTEIFKLTNITIESLLEEVIIKDKKWLEMIKDYTKNTKLMYKRKPLNKEKVQLTNGLYFGLWSGYELVIQLPNKNNYRLDTIEGVRGINCETNVEVVDGFVFEK